MTDSRSDGAQAASEDTAAWLAAITRELIAAGFAADLNETAGGLDLTASMHRPGQKETDVIVDEDGYAEIHWWTQPGATPAEVAAAIARAVTAVTGHWPRKGRVSR